MELLIGQVSQLKSSIEVSGGNEGQPLVTVHVSTFSINGRSVTVRSGWPVIQDGNTVVVAGLQLGSAFKTLAWQNETTGEKGDEGVLLPGLVCLVLIGVSIVAFLVAVVSADAFPIGFGVQILGWLTVLLSLLMFGHGVRGLVNCVRVHAAIRLLDRRATGALQE